MKKKYGLFTISTGSLISGLFGQHSAIERTRITKSTDGESQSTLVELFETEVSAESYLERIISSDVLITILPVYSKDTEPTIA